MSETSFEYLCLLGYQLLRHGKVARAITVLDAVLLLKPSNQWARRALAGAHLAAHQYELCLQHLSKLNQQSAPRMEDDLMRGRALWGMQRHREARQVIDHIQPRLRHIHEQ